MIDLKKTRGKILKNLAASVFLLLVLYVGTYIPNSLAGGWMVNESGKCRVFGLAHCDQFIWMPRFGFCQKFTRANGRDGIRAWGFGKLYCPLILMDQAYFHPTIHFMNEDLSFTDPLPAPPLEKYHPSRENRFLGRFPYGAVTNETEMDAEQTLETSSK